MCLSQLIKQRSHQLWDSQSIYSSNGQRRAGLTTQRESRGKLNKYNTDTHTHTYSMPFLNHTGLELECEPKAGLALLIVKCGCIKQTLNAAGTSGTTEKPQLERPLIKSCSRPSVHQREFLCLLRPAEWKQREPFSQYFCLVFQKISTSAALPETKLRKTLGNC